MTEINGVAYLGGRLRSETLALAQEEAADDGPCGRHCEAAYAEQGRLSAASAGGCLYKESPSCREELCFEPSAGM